MCRPASMIVTQSGGEISTYDSSAPVVTRVKGTKD